jgi:hypothetical protein
MFFASLLDLITVKVVDDYLFFRKLKNCRMRDDIIFQSYFHFKWLLNTGHDHKKTVLEKHK